MGNALVRTNRYAPHRAVFGLLGTLFNRETRNAIVDGCCTNTLGVQTSKHLAQALPFLTHQTLRAELHIVKKHGEGCFRHVQRSFNRRAGDAGCIGGNDEQRQLMTTLCIHHVAAADHHDGVGFIHARGPVLGAIEQPTVAVLAGGGGHLVGVGTGIRFGDGKGHALLARGQSWQPFILQSLAAMRLNDGRTNGANHQRQHGATLRSRLFHDDVVVGQAAAATAVLL